MPWAHSAQLRRSQPAFIIVMIMKLVSVSRRGSWPFVLSDPTEQPGGENGEAIKESAAGAGRSVRRERGGECGGTGAASATVAGPGLSAGTVAASCARVSVSP